MASKKKRKIKIDRTDTLLKKFTTFAQLKLFSYIFFAIIVPSSRGDQSLPIA